VLRQSVGEEKWLTLRDDLIATYTGDGAARIRARQAASDADPGPDRAEPGTPSH
jgi:hypothetical protein